MRDKTGRVSCRAGSDSQNRQDETCRMATHVAMAMRPKDACRNTSAMLRVDEEEGSRAWVPREGEKRRQLNRRAKPRQTLLPPAGPEDRLSVTSQNNTFQRRLTWRYGPETYFKQVCKHSRECLVVASIWRDLERNNKQACLCSRTCTENVSGRIAFANIDMYKISYLVMFLM